MATFLHFCDFTGTEGEVEHKKYGRRCWFAAKSYEVWEQ